MGFWKWIYDMIKDVMPYAIFFGIVILSVILPLIISIWVMIQLLDFFGISQFSTLALVATSIVSMTTSILGFLYMIYCIENVEFFSKLEQNMIGGK